MSERIRITKKKMNKTNHFIYFINRCKIFKYQYCKYRASMLWEGPAIILLQENHKQIADIIQKIKIKLAIDIIQCGMVAIYPCKNEITDSITYTYIHKLSPTEIDCIDWEYMGQPFLLNETNGNIYDASTRDFVGRRTQDNTIDYDVKE